MAKKRVDSHSTDKPKHNRGLARRMPDVILGGQDGIVNILGLVLGVASATSLPKIVIIAGLASTFAESISMGAVAYTSTEAALAYYRSLAKREMHEIRKHPKAEREEIKRIFAKKGLKGTLLNRVVQRVTSSRRRWLGTMLADELKISPPRVSPLDSAIVVFFASLVGSIIPIIPFFFLPITEAMIVAVAIASVVLFVTGAFKAKITIGTWWKSGLGMMMIGIVSAIAGYLIGSILGIIL